MCILVINFHSFYIFVFNYGYIIIFLRLILTILLFKDTKIAFPNFEIIAYIMILQSFIQIIFISFNINFTIYSNLIIKILNLKTL